MKCALLRGYLFSAVATPLWALAQTELCSGWVKVVSLKKKGKKKKKRKNQWFCFSVLFFCFVFFSPILSCSVGWTLHQCYSKYRSFSSEAISRIFGSSEDKTSPQIWQWRATGGKLAILDVWKIGDCHGLLFYLIYNQLHGPKLCQTTATEDVLWRKNQISLEKNPWNGF